MKMMLNVDVFEVLIILSIFVNFYSSSWQHVRKIIYKGDLIGSIIHKSGAPTQHWLFFITNNQFCVPVNPEVGRKISYIEVQ